MIARTPRLGCPGEHGSSGWRSLASSIEDGYDLFVDGGLGIDLALDTSSFRVGDPGGDLLDAGPHSSLRMHRFSQQLRWNRGSLEREMIPGVVGLRR